MCAGYRTSEHDIYIKWNVENSICICLFVYVRVLDKRCVECTAHVRSERRITYYPKEETKTMIDWGTTLPIPCVSAPIHTGNFTWRDHCLLSYRLLSFFFFSHIRFHRLRRSPDLNALWSSMSTSPPPCSPVSYVAEPRHLNFSHATTATTLCFLLAVNCS